MSEPGISPRRAHAVLHRVVFLLLLGVIAAASAEITARVDDRIRLGVPILHAPDEEADLTITDSTGRRGKPYGRYKRWHLNAFGFRSPEMSAAPPAGCTRIMVLGASESFGLYEADGKEYPAQLRAMLAPHGCYEVVNAALAGLGVRSLTALWNEWGSRFGPQVVLIYPTPMFYLSEREPRYPSRHGPVRVATAPPWWHPRLLDRAHDVFHYPDFIQQRRVRRMLAATDDTHRPDWFWHDIPAERLRLFSQDLDSLIVTIRAHGAEPVLITHAMSFHVPPSASDSAMLNAWRTAAPRATTATLLAFEVAAADAVRELGARRHVQVIDAARRLSGHEGWFADFAHFTDTGATAMARLIADGILADSVALRPAPVALRSARVAPER